MDNSTFQSLSEAYLSIYEGEGSYGQTPKATKAYLKLVVDREKKPASEYSKRGEKTKKVNSAWQHVNSSENIDASKHKSKKSTEPYWTSAHRKGMTPADRTNLRGGAEYGDAVGYDPAWHGSSGPGSLPKGKKLTRQRKTGVSEEFDTLLSNLIDEAASDQSNKQIEKGVKTTYKAGNVLDNLHQGRSPGMNKLPATERRAKEKRMRGRLKTRRDDLFGERNKREDEERAKLKKYLTKEEVVIGYLLDEGFVNNEVSAEVFIEHMSDEWLDSILEGYKDLPVGKMMKKAISRTRREGEAGSRLAREYDSYGPNSSDEKIDKLHKEWDKTQRDAEKNDKMIDVADKHNPYKVQGKEQENKGSGAEWFNGR